VEERENPLEKKGAGASLAFIEIKRYWHFPSFPGGYATVNLPTLSYIPDLVPTY
jgi:hypothetical protein